MLEAMFVLTILLVFSITYTVLRVYSMRKAAEKVFFARGYVQVFIRLKTGKSCKGYMSRASLRSYQRYNSLSSITLEHIRPEEKTLIKVDDIEYLKQTRPPI